MLIIIKFIDFAFAIEFENINQKLLQISNFMDPSKLFISVNFTLKNITNITNPFYIQSGLFQTWSANCKILALSWDEKFMFNFQFSVNKHHHEEDEKLLKIPNLMNIIVLSFTFTNWYATQKTHTKPRHF